MNDRHIHLHIVDLDTDAAGVAAHRTLLNTEECARAARFVRERDRCRWTVARGALRAILGLASGAEPAKLDFAAGRNGKPRLNDHADLHFNLSHSGAIAVVAVTRAGPLGADVEAARDIRDRDAVVRRFFSAAEQAAYLDLPPAERTQGFYNGWTRKEAVIKATGEGLSADLCAFDVSLAPGAPPRLLRVAGDPRASDRWQLFTLTPRSGYTAAVAIEADAVLELRVHEYAAFPSAERMG